MATSTETTIFISNLVTGNQSSGNETTTTTTTTAVETTYLPADDVTDEDVSTEVKAASASVLTVLHRIIRIEYFNTVGLGKSNTMEKISKLFIGECNGG